MRAGDKGERDTTVTREEVGDGRHKGKECKKWQTQGEGMEETGNIRKEGGRDGRQKQRHRVGRREITDTWDRNNVVK